MRHKTWGRGRRIRQGPLRRGLRKSLKAAGHRRPVALLRARQAIGGLFRRGDVFNTMLDVSRDIWLPGGERKPLADVLEFYGQFLYIVDERRAEQAREPK